MTLFNIIGKDCEEIIIDYKEQCEKLKCSICSKYIEDLYETRCNHFFCKYCINQWFKHSTHCPSCLEIHANKDKFIKDFESFNKLNENNMNLTEYIRYTYKIHRQKIRERMFGLN